jgi:hypothetical protein
MGKCPTCSSDLCDNTHINMRNDIENNLNALRIRQQDKNNAINDIKNKGALLVVEKNNIIKTEDGYIIEENGIFSHGKSIKEARDSLIYKIGDRDTSEYNEATLNTVLNFKDAVKMYRVITGACEQGTKIFVKNLENVKEEYSIKEIIEITTGHFGNEKLINFFKVK